MARLVWVLYFTFVFTVIVSLVAAETESEEYDLCGFGDVDQTKGSICLNVSGSDASSELLCSRAIRIKESGRLQLNVTDFRIDEPKDIFEIFDGPHSGARSVTNISTPFVFSASGNAVFIRFQRRNGLKVASSYFRASFHAVPYPRKCLCRPVKNGALECEDKYQEKVCHIKCDEGHYDISFGRNITCDMQKDGKWSVDIHQRTLSCQKVSAPLKIRLTVSFNYLLNGTCEQSNLDAIKKLFQRLLLASADVQKNGKCFADKESKCTSKRIEVRCEGGTRKINVNITDEVARPLASFVGLYNAYGGLEFGTVLSKLREQNVTVNETSLLKEPITPLCQDPTHSFFKLLITGKKNFSNVCSSCPLHHFYDSKTSQCIVCPQGSTAPEGTFSCMNGSVPAVPIQHKCDTSCMLGKQYDKSSGFCEWCPQNQYQDSKEFNPTCRQCPLNKYTPFSGAANLSWCVTKCRPGSFFKNTICAKCPVNTYQDQSNLFTQCKACGHGQHTVAEGSTEETKCLGPCSPGQFFDEQARECGVCPIHSYQDQVNQPQCKNCSDGKMTLNRGAKSESSCIVPCQAGQMFNTGTMRCGNCSAGSFQDQKSHLESKCKPCKRGETTKESGAKNVSECILACPAGEFANENKKCQNCLRGYFQDLPNQSSCKKCPAGKTTQEDGQTNSTACVYLCPAGKFLDAGKNCSSCPFGTYQDATEHSLHKCIPCPSGETSVASGATSASLCLMGCDMYPCQHGAPCISVNGGFTCDCGNGLHGKRCEVIENKNQLRTVEMSLHITSIDWVEQLEDHITAQYNLTKGHIESEIGKLMNATELYIAVEVTDLKKNSVVAYMTLYFGEKSDPIPARKLQTAAAHGSVGNLTVSSLEVLQQTCRAALGMEVGYIKDHQITDNTNVGAGKGRLNRKGWKAMHDKNEFLQIDFQQRVNITAVASQGMQDCYVKSYKLAFSGDGQAWTDYKEGKIFLGNNNSDFVMKNSLDSSVVAHFIRFKPQSWNHHICMRVEVYGCLLDPTISAGILSTSSAAVTTATASPSSLVHATTLASKEEYTWGAYLGIAVLVLFLAGVVVAICRCKHKSKSKKLVHTAEQDLLLGVRKSDGIGGYKFVKGADDDENPDGKLIETEENQV